MFYWKNLRNFVDMKTSIDFLPKFVQRDLHQLVTLIREEMQDVGMIILFGSYAKNTFVRHDVTEDYGGGLIEFNSDYDILVVSKKRLGKSEGNLETRIRDRFAEGKEEHEVTKVQLISESISKLNNALSEGRYFYVDAITEGVMLYNTEGYQLATPKKLDYAKIREIANEYYDERFSDGVDFIKGANFYYKDSNYQKAIFLLHQATENLIKAIPLVYALYGHKEHDLEFLLNKSKCYTLELMKVFPRDTEQGKRLFALLRRAYLEARYNKKNFIVTKEDVDALTPKVKQLEQIVEKVCRERIAFYDAQSKKQS